MGRDRPNSSTPSSQSVFQSTRPHGARRFFDGLGDILAVVSIHAPAWGATWKRHRPISPAWRFQSTRPHGARRVFQDWGLTLPEFQSTRPHGARHGGAGGHGHVGALSFNPRARMGRDDGLGADGLGEGGVSIHAPAWGATLCLIQSGLDDAAFQSTRPHGARRPRPGPSCSWARVSIHAPAWGATFALAGPWPRQTVSIHAPAWGATVPS